MLGQAFVQPGAAAIGLGEICGDFLRLGSGLHLDLDDGRLCLVQQRDRVVAIGDAGGQVLKPLVNLRPQPEDLRTAHGVGLPGDRPVGMSERPLRIVGIEIADGALQLDIRDQLAGEIDDLPSEQQGQHEKQNQPPPAPQALKDRALRAARLVNAARPRLELGRNRESQIVDSAVRCWHKCDCPIARFPIQA